ncbi:MAG: substrate-binding domain-containing protein [Alphaproteobacteria bacterium]
MKLRFAMGALLASLSFSTHALAADLKVLATGATRGIVTSLAVGFERASGHRVTITSDTAGGVRRRIEGGEAADVVIGTPAVFQALSAAGKIAGSAVPIASTGVGVGVKEGAPSPDISTVEAFKATLLAAKSITYTDPAGGGTSGAYVASLIERLGLTDAMRGKTRLRQGGYAAEWVASGEIELVIHQISEIVPVRGARLVGPLPADIQMITTYAAAVASNARDPDAARAFLAHLTGPESVAVLAAAGMDRPTPR